MLKHFIRSIASMTLLSIAYCLPISAESPAPTQTPSAMETDFSSLEFNLLETAYKTTPDANTRNQLITAGEKVINSYCIDGVSPNYSKQNTEPNSTCDKFIQRLLKYDPFNPAVACAQNGINSPECFNAYASTGASSFNGYSQSNKDLEAYLTASQQTSLEIETQLSPLEQNYFQTHDAESGKQIETLLIDNLPKVCNLTRYDVTESSAQPKPTTPIAPRKNTKPFEDVLEQLKNPSAQATPEVPITRHRLVSNGCLNLLEHLKKFSPQHYYYLCTVNGPYSPQCLRARKAAAAASRAAKQDAAH